MYIVLAGGMSIMVNGSYDAELPFDNSVTTVRIKNGGFEQFLMLSQYPEILATFGNIGAPLLFGTSATFFPAKSMPLYSNGVIAFDKPPKSKVLMGYIVGGIESSRDNTVSEDESAASPYIFEVYLTYDKDIHFT